jgi:hypothetical protein
MGAHPGQQGLADLEHSGEVELQQGLPMVQGHLGQAAGVSHAGVVDQHIRGRCPFSQGVEGRGNGTGIAQVEVLALHGMALSHQLSNELVETVGRTGQQLQSKAGGGKAAGSRRTNAAGSAGDQN